MKYKLSAEIIVPVDQRFKIKVPTFGHMFILKALHTLKKQWKINFKNIKVTSPPKGKKNYGKA